MDYVAVSFTPRPLARRIKVSYDLLRLSLLNPEAHVREPMSQVLLQVLENAYLRSEGGAGPLGLFVNNANGISSARDVTASSTTSFTYDDLVNCVGALRYQ